MIRFLFVLCCKKGTYEMLVSPASNYGYISQYNGQKNLPYWYSELANSIGGTDGTFFAPDSSVFAIPSTIRNMEIFDPQFCRSIQLVHRNTMVKHGVFVHRYMPAITTLFHSTPINEGFCNKTAYDYAYDSRKWSGKSNDHESKLTFCAGTYQIMDVRKCNNGTP